MEKKEKGFGSIVEKFFKKYDRDTLTVFSTLIETTSDGNYRYQDKNGVPDIFTIDQRFGDSPLQEIVAEFLGLPKEKQKLIENEIRESMGVNLQTPENEIDSFMAFAKKHGIKIQEILEYDEKEKQ